MIAVDSSAILAILCDEPEADRLRAKLKVAKQGLISAANVLELQIVVAGLRSMTGWVDVEALLKAYDIAVSSFDDRQLRAAREAVLRYGKGRHKAALNFGDCFAYALARTEGLALLFTGRDFSYTDIEMA